MAITEAVSRSISEAVSPYANDAASASEGDAASSSAVRKTAALWVATLLTLGLVGVLGYTQWWIPREQAQQRAQVEHEHCLQEVKVYLGKRSYKARLDQCNKFLTN